MRPRTPGRQPITGCDLWRSENGRQWNRWDQWFCALAAADHGGDLGALDAAIEVSRSGWGERDREAILVQLDDLRRRLDESALTCANLIGDPLTDPRRLAKARAKVLTQSLQERDRTHLMLRTPRMALKERAMFGSWDRFPVSPDIYMDQFDALIERRPWYGEAAAMHLAASLRKRATKLDEHLPVENRGRQGGNRGGG